MPKIRSPQGMMTVQEAARKLVHDGHALSTPDSIAITLRAACDRGAIPCRKQPIGPVGARTARLVRYADVHAFWMERYVDRE